jgi:hypothetical protein
LTTVTLIDGTEVDSASEAWRMECLQRHKHVQALLALQGTGSRHLRQDYLRRVEANEGAEAKNRLVVAFSQAWEQRQRVREAGG